MLVEHRPIADNPKYRPAYSTQMPQKRIGEVVQQRNAPEGSPQWVNTQNASKNEFAAKAVFEYNAPH